MVSPIFVYAVVKDREDKLRHLLNIAGLRPVSYWIGIWFAEWLLYCIPITALIIIT
jgi:hypothetical protein